MTRNKGVDIFRTIALLLVVIYHAWSVCGAPSVGSEALKLLVGFGGEIGVTSFFCLSGFGIYQSLYVMEQKDTLSFQNHIKKRFLRVAPQYYLNLMVLVLFGSSVIYLSKDGIWNIISHILFAHNISIVYQGAMNGVLWTMAIIFQFYLVAIPLYKFMKKNPYLFWIASVVFTVGMKFLALRWSGVMHGADETWCFYVGRQLCTSLDNFTIGMFVAFLINKKTSFEIKKWMKLGVGLAGFLALFVVCVYGKLNGIHRTGISGYLWHSMLAITIGMILYSFSQIQFKEQNILVKVLLWISEIEYGVYLWHLVIFQNLIGGSGWITDMVLKGHILSTISILSIIAIMVGALFTKMTDTCMKVVLVKDKKKE